MNLFKIFYSRKTKLKSRSGIVFISALVVTVILFSLGIGFMQMTQSEARTVGSELKQLQAFHYAESGIEQGIAEILFSSDADGDGGIGSIAPKDIDSDGKNDYSVSYDSVTGIMQSTGVESSTESTVDVQINSSGFTSALMAGDGMNISDVTGSINGDVESGPMYPISLPAGVTLYGKKIEHPDFSPSPEYFPDMIPNPSFTSYESAAAADHKFGPTGDPWTPVPFTSMFTPDVDGIYRGLFYIENAVDVLAPNITIEGCLVVNGPLYLGTTADGLTIDASLQSGCPALLVNNIIGVQAYGDPTPLENVTIKGLVFSKSMITLGNINNFYLKGVLVSQPSNLEIHNITNFVIDYDPTTNPLYFSGGRQGAPVVVSWKGHR